MPGVKALKKLFEHIQELSRAIGEDVGSIIKNIGSLESLKTSEKASVVGAINELVDKGFINTSTTVEYVNAANVDSKFSTDYFAGKDKGLYYTLIHSNDASIREAMGGITDFVLVTTYNTYSAKNRLVQTAVSVRSGKIYSRGTTESGQWGSWNEERSMVPISEEIYDEGWIKVSRQQLAEMNGIVQDRNGAYPLSNGVQYKVLYNKTYEFKPIPLIIVELGKGNFISYSGQYLNDHFLIGVNYGAAFENLYYRIINDPQNTVTKSEKDFAADFNRLVESRGI